MSKNIVCMDCHAIGSLGDNEMLYNNVCPYCGGDLLRVHSGDFWKLENRSDCRMMPDMWNDNHVKSRDATTCVEYKGKLPKVRIIRDTHPCETCSHYGTYHPEITTKTPKTIGSD